MARIGGLSFGCQPQGDGFGIRGLAFFPYHPFGDQPLDPFGDSGLGDAHQLGKPGDIDSLVISYGFDSVNFRRKKTVFHAEIHAFSMACVNLVHKVHHYGQHLFEIMPFSIHVIYYKGA